MKTGSTIFRNYDFSTPVVILKCLEDSYIGLGVIRSLGRLGVPVYAIVTTLRTPARFSRYSKTLWFPELSAETSDEELLNYLFQVVEKIDRRSILISTMDAYSKFVARHSEALGHSFVFCSSDVNLVEGLCSKQGMYLLAKKHDVPIATAAFPKSRSEVEEFAENALFPVVLKAVDWTVLECRPMTKTFIVNSPKELLQEFEAHNCLGFPNVMLQEYIYGAGIQDWIFNGYFDDQSNCLVSFTGKKLRQAPVYTGYSSLGECAKNEVVEATSIKFLKAIGYKGVVDIDYRYDPKDGVYKILDVNPRVGASFRLFVGRDGLDVVRAMYLDKTGQNVPRDFQVDGRKWIVEDSDLRSAYTYYRHHGLSLIDYLKSLRGVKEGAWFALDDPSPFIMRIRDHIAAKV